MRAIAAVTQMTICEVLGCCELAGRPGSTMKPGVAKDLAPDHRACEWHDSYLELLTPHSLFARLFLYGRGFWLAAIWTRIVR